MTFQEGTEADIKELDLHVDSGLYYKQSAQTGQTDIVKEWALYSSPDRQKYNISLSVLEIRNIDDTKNTFDAEIYLTLDDCNDSRSKDRPPYIEWKNCIGTPKSQESEKSLSEIWKDEVAKLDTAVEVLKKENASQEKIAAAKKKHVKIRMGFEGTFILPHRASVLSFPYDHQELSIQICTDEPKNCEFRPARPNPCILKREALATLQNWVGVREKKKQSEMGKKKKGRFLKFSAKQAVGLFYGLCSYIARPFAEIGYICGPETKQTEELDAPDWEYWMPFRQHRTNANASAEGNVYGLITCNTVVLRESSSLTDNLILPSTMLAIATLFQYWIHPTDVGARSEFIITMMLAVLALKLAVSTMVPPLSRPTFLDSYLFHNLLFPFLVGGFNIVGSRNCLPECEPQFCATDLGDFEVPLAGSREFHKQLRKDYAQDNYEVEVSSKIGNTTQWVPFCECVCDMDDYIFYGACTYFVILHITFLYSFLRTRFEFYKILNRSNLEIHRIE